MCSVATYFRLTYVQCCDLFQANICAVLQPFRLTYVQCCDLFQANVYAVLQPFRLMYVQYCDLSRFRNIPKNVDSINILLRYCFIINLREVSITAWW